MEFNKDQNKQYIKAKKKFERLKIFYLHLVLYLIVVALLSYNFYIMEGPYVSIITGLNVTVLVLWTVFISLHAWRVFKGRLIFRKSWEDRKIDEFINEKDKEETTFWE